MSQSALYNPEHTLYWWQGAWTFVRGEPCPIGSKDDPADSARTTGWETVRRRYLLRGFRHMAASTVTVGWWVGLTLKPTEAQQVESLRMVKKLNVELSPGKRCRIRVDPASLILASPNAPTMPTVVPGPVRGHDGIEVIGIAEAEFVSRNEFLPVVVYRDNGALKTLAATAFAWRYELPADDVT